jgi:photosystem II stability/assembly factor-like uncharacterized protein
MKYKNLVSFLLAFVIIFLNNQHAVSQPWMSSQYLKKSGETANFYEIKDAFYKWWGDKPYERGKGYKQFKRWEWRYEAKSFPDGKIPSSIQYYNAYKEFCVGIDNKNPKSGFWTPMGIITWTNGNSGYNPGNGRLNAVTVDPHNRNIIYIAAASGGIWKTIDGGMTWNTTYDTMPVMGTSAIAVQPDNSDIVFCGTGDRDAWDTPGIGVLKSTDGGTTWNATGLTFNPMGKNINKILINPLNPNRIFAASNVGIYRTKNGGTTWQIVYNGSGVNDIKFKPGDTTIIYGSGSNFVRSSNGGNSFSKITATLPHDTGRVEFDVTAANSSVVYVVASRPNSTFEGVYKSTDSGLTFTNQSNSPNILGYSDIGDDESGQAWYDLAIAVSPSNENEVWVGGINIWKSTNAGVDWTVNTMWYTNSPYNYIHCDIHSVNFYGDTLYVGSDGGVFYTPNHGSSWNDISAGLGVTQFYRLGCSKNNSEHIAAGAQDVGSNVYKNGTWTHVYGADGMEALISHGDENTIFVTYQMGGLLRSEDGGQNFVGAKPVDSIDGGWITPYVQHPVNPMVLYAGYKDVWKTSDGGYSWFPISTDLTGGENINQLVIAPSNSNYIYASYNATLYYTSDEGANWNTSVPNAGLYITGIAVDPTNPLRIWITATSSSSDRVYYSSNGGAAFSNVTGNLTSMGFNCIVYQAGNNDGLYIGTELGVVYKDSTMAQWIPWDTDLPHVPVDELEIQYASGKLRAATYGRGIWDGPLSTTVGIAENQPYNCIVYPNPAKDFLNIQIKGLKTEKLEIRLFNIAGMQVKSMKVEGNNAETIRMDVSGLSAGNYYLGIYDGTRKVFSKVSLVAF